MTENTTVYFRKYYDVGLQIEAQLNAGKYIPGQKLPSERELCEQFNTTRATIREAIIMLELKQLVEVRQGAGIYVRHYDEEKLFSSLYVTTLPKDIGPFELLQARRVLEVSIVEFAAQNIKINEIRQLNAVLKEQEQNIEGDSASFERLDRQFHLLIAEATQNRVLIDASKRLWDIVRTENALWKQLNHEHFHKLDFKISWLNEHKNILHALTQRNTELAKVAIIEHLEHSKLELIKLAGTHSNSLELDDLFFANENNF